MPRNYAGKKETKMYDTICFYLKKIKYVFTLNKKYPNSVRHTKTDVTFFDLKVTHYFIIIVSITVCSIEEVGCLNSRGRVNIFVFGFSYERFSGTHKLQTTSVPKYA